MSEREVLRDIAKRYKDRVRTAIKKDYKIAVNHTNRELYKEIVKMYDSFITQFYEYKTSVYIRHGQSAPGTGTGENLFRGQQIKILSDNTDSPELSIFYDGTDMIDEYKFDYAENVLRFVMAGIRFPYWNSMTWSGYYYGKYFQYSGNLQHAFDLFESTFDDIAEKVFYPKWYSLGWYKPHR